MKNKRLMSMLSMSALLAALVLGGCSSPLNNDDPDSEPSDSLEGKLLILQAYGSGDNASPAGSHSFVELYNTTDEEIDLAGVILWFADGTRVAAAGDPPAEKDMEWDSIALSGSIPAGGSYLIRGKQSEGASHRLQVANGDKNDNSLVLGNRSFKVALIQGSTELSDSIQNPFNHNGSKVTGYIDMVGAANDPTHATRPDLLFGYEGPANSTAFPRNSAQEAVRRTSPTDTNNNADDFESIRYAPTTDSNPGISDELFELRRPKNATETADGWRPFAEPEDDGGDDDDDDEYEGLPPTTVGAASAHAGELLILQIGAGAADNEANVTRSFVELYNAGATPVDLSGFTLQYAAGTKVAGGASKDGKWEKIALSGTIEPGHSYLILGSKISTLPNPALDFEEDSYGDIYDADFVLSNRAVKVVLIESTDLLTVQNPFNMDGGKAAGYVDMIGVVNDNSDQIFGLEGTIPLISGQYRISKQVGVRRTCLTDTDVNSDDFRIVTYNNIKNDAEQFELMRPKNSEHGAWDPFPEPEEDDGGDDDDDDGEAQAATLRGQLLILQAYASGTATDGAVSHTFVELYNNTDSPIVMDNENNKFSLQYGKTGTTWTKIDLEGTIPAGGSFLVQGPLNNVYTGSGNVGNLTINDADQTVSTFVMDNDGFKVVLMRNQTTLTVAQPWNSDDALKAAGYIDMVASQNSSSNQPDGYEDALPGVSSKQAAARRGSLTDTDNNVTDFARIDYRANQGMDAANLAKYRPRYSGDGSWTPTF